ncbi:MAG: hypothetical protein AAGL34_04150 [Bacteroidota bacterium]
MQHLKKENVIRRIQEVTADLKITAYEFAKHVPMSEVGIAKILSNKVKNPNKTSVEAIVHYLTEHHGISSEWLLKGEGLMKIIEVPSSEEFYKLSKSQKESKLDEIALFVAHHETELMKNPIFRSLVERRGYETVIKKIKESENIKQ